RRRGAGRAGVRVVGRAPAVDGRRGRARGGARGRSGRPVGRAREPVERRARRVADHRRRRARDAWFDRLTPSVDRLATWFDKLTTSVYKRTSSVDRLATRGGRTPPAHPERVEG